ncbi:MAG: peptidylprolyl isomerase [Pelagibacteraceae bacterium]|nr:peptidylprolyl isomerase [Pelagibacteraceae bacterium]
MRKNIKLLIAIILLSTMLLTSSKAELTNKVIISVGDEIITNYDLDREIKYLNVITVGQIAELDNQESKKIAIDSLIKDKIKITALSSHPNIIIKEELINNQIVRSSQNIGFRSIDDFKTYLNYTEYELDEFKKKILLELKWNQLVYQFYKNQIIIDKEKIDKKLKTLIAEEKKNVEYLVYEIFIENSAIKELDEEIEEELNENNVVEELPKNKVVDEKNSGIIIETESASYNNKKNSIVEEKSIEKMVEVKTDDQITKTKKKDQITIDDVMENIKEEGFENTAIQFSSSPTAQQGGNLGWISESKLSKLLLKSIKKTKIGSITEPISVSGGVLILKVENKRVEETNMDIDKKMKKLIEIEKNNQLNNFSTNYFNQVKNNIKIKYFND